MLANYRRALELDPGNAELAVKVAYELARRNDAPAGIQILKDAIKAAPKQPLPYIYLSQLYSKYLKKADLAQTYADQAIALAPDQFTGYLALFELHEAAGQKQKAEAALERALKNDTKDARFWLQFGDHLQKRHLKEDGSSAPAELQRMNAIYAKAAELGKEDGYVLGKVADFHVMSKQVEASIPFYRAVLKLPPHPENPGLGIFREKLARALVFTSQADEAVGVIEELLRENGQRFEFHELLGELYEKKGDLDKALVSYEHSLQLDASEPRNHLRLTNLLLQMKRYDRAVEMLQMARKKWPDLPSITYRLALSLSHAKRHQEALQAFSDAMADAEKRDEEMLNAGFYFMYGAVAEQAGDIQKAVELLKQSIELDPNAPDAYNYLGYMWADRGERLDEAGELIKKAVELEPNNGAYLDSLGWFYFKQGNADKALKELLRAQESIVREYKQDDATVLDHIADVYSKLGNNGEALQYWQKALTLENDDEKLREKIVEKLESVKQKVTAAPPTAPAEPAKQ
ncbi:MAG: Tetratricopeptide 2 repeat protein [Chthoniobacter sp.]|nr:Tetratricopeptide 2 repeat protein [Chthoniobacter sp.]